jgi:hypothetical protein
MVFGNLKLDRNLFLGCRNVFLPQVFDRNVFLGQVFNRNLFLCFPIYLPPTCGPGKPVGGVSPFRAYIYNVTPTSGFWGQIGMYS